jgi:hypothetical protein
MADEADPRLVLAYDESVRAWALQSAVLDELRSRAGVLIAATSVSSAFLGADAVPGKDAWSAADIIAIGLFGVVVALCVYVLWPARNWIFAHNGKRLIEKYFTDHVTVDEMYKRMTIDNAQYRQENRKRIDYRFMAFRIACLGLAADVALWLLALHEGG